MRSAVLALVAGCGFHVPTGSAVDDAKPSDDAGSVDDGGVEGDSGVPADVLLPDTPVMEVEECTLRRTGSTMTAGLLGGTGQRSGDVTCDSDRVGVGLQFDVTPSGISNHGDHILMTSIRLWCGTIERNEMNQMVTSNLTVSSYTGLQGSSQTACNPYQPVVALGQVMCPSGAVLVAIRGHQVDSTLYNDVSIQCAALTSTGSVSTSIVTIAMPGTGTNNLLPEQSQCPAGTAITSIHATSGCGQDGATATCTATVCEEEDE